MLNLTTGNFDQTTARDLLRDYKQDILKLNKAYRRSINLSNMFQINFLSNNASINTVKTLAKKIIAFNYSDSISAIGAAS